MEIQNEGLVPAAPEVPDNAETVEASQQEGDNPEGEEGQPEKPQETEAEKQFRKERNRWRREAERRAFELDNFKREVEQRLRAAQNPQGQKPQQQASQEDIERIIEQRAAERVAQREHAARIEQEMDSAREKFADFDEVIGDIKEMPISDTLFSALQRAKGTAEILYHFGENPDVLARLNRMNAVDAAMEVAELSHKLRAVEPKKAATSKAPAPINPVRQTASRNSMPNPSDTKAWIKAANERERNSR